MDEMTQRVDVQVRTNRVWQSLGDGAEAPRISESQWLELRGLKPGEHVLVGPAMLAADEEGHLSVRLLEHETLRGHLGLVEVRRESNSVAGEFEVVPDKMSEEAFRDLRAALEQVWAGLIFDPDGVGRLRGVLPSPVDLWRAIEAPVREIAAEPRTVLTLSEGVRRQEAVRRSYELTTAVVRAATMQRAGRSRVLTRSMNTPENALVAETLRRLASYARRQPDGSEVATRASRMLREDPFASCGALRGGVEAARVRMLYDARYRRVDKVLRVLDCPEAHATEGPGEARLGVKGMIRLYEYWVFMQVLQACRDRYGTPLTPGFSILGRQIRSGPTRLSLSPGVTVRFPDDVHVAFEPRITSSGRGWMNLENVPHPNPDYAQDVITPDVVVLRGGAEPALAVFDAKYVGRHWVERAAAEIHHRYSRIRWHGQPVARNVLAAHPHQGIDFLWAGYGSVPMIPGQPTGLNNLLP